MSRCGQIVQILYISNHVTVWSSFKRHFFLSLNLNSCAEAFLASFFDLLNQLDLCSKQLSCNYLYILYVLLVGDIEVKSLLSCMRQNKQKQFAQLILKIYFFYLSNTTQEEARLEARLENICRTSWTQIFCIQNVHRSCKLYLLLYFEPILIHLN